MNHLKTLANPVHLIKEHIIVRAEGVKLFANVRNEAHSLPFFLEYYRQLGVNDFFIVDNNSTDGTARFLKEQRDVTLYFTDESFIQNRCGLNWLNRLRNRYGRDSWCLTLDCDELIVFPNSEHVNLPRLCEYLSENNYQGMFTLMLDFYDNKPVSHYEYSSGEDFLATCPYFDPAGYFVTDVDQFPYFGVFGGPRYRAFYKEEGKRQGPTMRKIPLVKWGDGVEYISVAHSTSPLRLADITGALLHFKYLSRFAEHVQEEVLRADRLPKDYGQYLKVLSDQPDLNLHVPEAERYENSPQLEKFGLIRGSENYSSWLGLKHSPTNAPPISASGTGKRADKPRDSVPPLEFSEFLQTWPPTDIRSDVMNSLTLTVIIPVHNAEKTLERAVASAINQAEVSEIILVEDGSNDRSLEICRTFSERHSIVRLVQHSDKSNHGAGPTRNLGINHATSEIIAFLDADDYYLPNRFSGHISTLIEEPLIDGVYGCQNFSFASEELEQQRRASGLGMYTRLSEPINPENLYLAMNPVGKKGSFHANTLTVRATIFEKVGLFWDKRTEDVEMWLRMAFSTRLKGHNLETPISTKYVHSQNRMNTLNTQKYRPQVFQSIIKYSAQREDDVPKTRRTLERYFWILKGAVERGDIDPSCSREALQEACQALRHRLGNYSHLIFKLNRQTQLMDPTELVTLIDNVFLISADTLDKEASTDNKKAFLANFFKYANTSKQIAGRRAPLAKKILHKLLLSSVSMKVFFYQQGLKNDIFFPGLYSKLKRIVNVLRRSKLR